MVLPDFHSLSPRVSSPLGASASIWGTTHGTGIANPPPYSPPTLGTKHFLPPQYEPGEEK